MIVGREVLQHEDGRICTVLQIALVVQDGTCLGEGTNSETVPGGDDLVVQARPDSLGSRFEQLLLRLLQTRRSFLSHNMEDVGTFEISGFCHPVVPHDRICLGAQNGSDIFGSPDVELSLDAFGVCIL